MAADKLPAIVWLGEPACQDRALVGGKAAILGGLAASYRVPPGFCLTTIADDLAKADSLTRGEAATLAAPLRRAVSAAYRSLGERCGVAEPPVAVRSSAVDEDSPAASFAGQYDTYLNVVGVDDIENALARCWGSARSDRVAEYRRQQALPLSEGGLAVLVQQLVVADVSVVAFSANPVTGARDEVVITAAWGLGESLVGGTVTPDTYVLRKSDLAVLSRHIAEKHRMTVAAPGGTREVDVPGFLRAEPTLDDAQAVEVARLAHAVEASMGWPVDIEGVYRDGSLYLLQCRSITALEGRRSSMSRPTSVEEEPTSDASITGPPAPIPAPVDFPVTWENPADARQFWTLNRMVCPDPITPMTGDFLRYIFRDGRNAYREAYGLAGRLEIRRINTYFYFADIRDAAAPMDQETQANRFEETLRAVLGRLKDQWTTEWLPEVKGHLAYWEAFNLRGAPLPALLAHLDETVARIRRVWEIHYLVGNPPYDAMDRFEELYRELFGGESGFEAFRLLQGFDNRTLQADRALWGLSQQALASPPVRAALDAHAVAPATGSVDAVLAVLRTFPEGRAFLQELRGFLDEYGQRADSKGELHSPSWAEDPTPAIASLKAYMAQLDRDPVAELEALAAERERLVAEAHGRLAGYPQAVLNEFEFTLKAAQEAVVVAEDHNFWIDNRSLYQLRRVLREFGHRLAAAGAIDHANDVFYLTLNELCETAGALPEADRRRLVADRKAEMDHFRTIAPPPALGTPPPGGPRRGPRVRAMAKFNGAPIEPSTDPGAVRGHAGAPGKVRGRARVLRSLAEAGKVERGDVLVTVTLGPPWTPLLATAAAVVTDTGGVLSHGAVVAREYRIPAVVGTDVGTSVLRDGQLVEVDGDAGIVRILDAV